MSGAPKLSRELRAEFDQLLSENLPAPNESRLEAELTELRTQVQTLLAMAPRQPPILRVVE